VRLSEQEDFVSVRFGGSKTKKADLATKRERAPAPAPQPAPSQTVQRDASYRATAEVTCPFCMSRHAEFTLTKSDLPTLFCTRCKTRVFCNGLNSEMAVRAVTRALREVEGLPEQLTAVYSQFIEPLPET
jgi:hypothetical protein